jgi:hypothetical protein
VALQKGEVRNLKGDNRSYLVHGYAKMMMADELAVTAPTFTGR